MARTPRGNRSAVPVWTEPMLAKPDGGRLRCGSQWAYEIKLDGYRTAMRIAPDGATVLTSRNGIDSTDEFPALAGVLAPALDGQAAVLDGEIVVYNNDGQPDFGALQKRRGAGHAAGRGAQGSGERRFRVAADSGAGRIGRQGDGP